MSLIENDVDSLIPRPTGSPLLDGLILGAVIGATGAALVVITQVVVTRRLARGAGGRRRPFVPLARPSEGSPL